MRAVDALAQQEESQTAVSGVSDPTATPDLTRAPSMHSSYSSDLIAAVRATMYLVYFTCHIMAARVI